MSDVFNPLLDDDDEVVDEVVSGDGSSVGGGGDDSSLVGSEGSVGGREVVSLPVVDFSPVVSDSSGVDEVVLVDGADVDRFAIEKLKAESERIFDFSYDDFEEEDDEDEYDDEYDEDDDESGLVSDFGDNLDSLLSVVRDRSKEGGDDAADLNKLESVITSVSGFGSPDYDEFEDQVYANFSIDKIFEIAIDQGASDVHLTPDDLVSFTILGNIIRMPEFDTVTPGIMNKLRDTIIPNVLESDFAEEFELDTSYVIREGKYKGRRLRLSVGRSFGNIFMVFRVISDQVPSPEELGITGELRSWVNLPNGLILVNGPTGSGKTTTIASLLREIQLERAQKIITIERPVEFVYGVEGKALVTQREVGRDSKSFSNALDSAMRQAPDIILVGEVRNRVEVDQLLRAAETGHLTISTMHTNNAPATINRIRSLYEGDEQLRVLSSLSDNLRGLANQVLLKSVDGKSRFAVREVLTVDREVSRMIQVGDVEGIRNYQLERGITLEHELAKAVRANKCTIEEARSRSSFPNYFNELLGV